ncbi:MAG: diadenylate cyclase CdaA [Fimbriimonadaceae bacterium]
MEPKLDNFIRQFRPFSAQSVVAIVDILLVAFIIYRILILVRGTRAWRVVAGVVIFVAVLFLSDQLGLTTLHWIFDKATVLAPVALVILFLPELRQALEGMGRFGLWTQKFVGAQEANISGQARTVEEIVAASAELSASRIGALMVLEKSAPLDDIVANGVQLEARVSSPLLVALFFEGNPLHDGAVIVRSDVIVAASCQLPMTESPLLSPHLHMRHRAGVGVTERLDCVAIIISEERGTIGIAVDGDYRVMQNQSELRDALNQVWRGVGTGELAAPRDRRRLFRRVK